MNRSDLMVLVRQMVSFTCVGAIGFAVDAGVLYIALFAGLGLYLGRVVSYLVAVSSTWLLNRRYTFGRRSDSSHFREWAKFAVSQLVGATINLGIYLLLVRTSPVVAQHPIIGVAAGSAGALLVNFSLARVYVFSH